MSQDAAEWAPPSLILILLAGAYISTIEHQNHMVNHVRHMEAGMNCSGRQSSSGHGMTMLAVVALGQASTVGATTIYVCAKSWNGFDDAM